MPTQTRLFPFTEHFTFPAVYPAGNLRVIGTVRISLLGPIRFYYFFLYILIVIPFPVLLEYHKLCRNKEHNIREGNTHALKQD